MLKISEIKEMIPAAVELFFEKFPNAEIPEIIVCSAARKRAVIKKAYDECGLDFNNYDDNNDDAGEVVIGPLGKRIVIYQKCLNHGNDLCIVIWHELGHIMMGGELQYGIVSKEATSLRSGFCLFSEFVAEYIAYFVGERTGLGIIYPDEYLEKAFSKKGAVQSYWLGRYMSILIGYEHVITEFSHSNFPYIDIDVWDCIVEIKNMLEEQVKNKEFWKPSQEYLEELGRLFNNIYSIVYNDCFDILKLVMDAINNGGKIPLEYGIKNVNVQ